MNVPTQIDNKVRYVTNSKGERTEVIIPVELWNQLLSTISFPTGLDPIDEEEPNNQILADLKTALQEVKEGKTFPISKLWEDIDV